MQSVSMYMTFPWSSCSSLGRYILAKLTWKGKMNLDVMWWKQRIVKRPTAARSQTQNTSGLSHQCSATEPQQPDNYQPSQSSICTACWMATRCVSEGIQYHLCSTYRVLWGLLIIQLSWLSSRGSSNTSVLDSIPSSCRPFHFPLISPHNI